MLGDQSGAVFRQRFRGQGSLLDTYVFLWYITADPKLPAAFRVASQDPSNLATLALGVVPGPFIELAKRSMLPLP